MSRRILMTGLLVGCLLGGWPLKVDVILAASLSRPATQVVTAPDLEQALLQEISRRYGRPAHRLSVQVLYPK